MIAKKLLYEKFKEEPFLLFILPTETQRKKKSSRIIWYFNKIT